MQEYQFNRIFVQMEREFGKIKKGQEEKFMLLLYPMETNAMKVHRANPKSNSRRLREAIALVLFDLKGRINGETVDVEAFRDDNNSKLEHALLMAFDPFTNEELNAALGGSVNEDLRQFYTVPIMCLLRIKDSIDTWEKRYGSDGYFVFLEETIGKKVNGDKMNFAICAKKEDLLL